MTYYEMFIEKYIVNILLDFIPKCNKNIMSTFMPVYNICLCHRIDIDKIDMMTFQYLA